MYASIRRYEVRPSDKEKVNKAVKTGFVPLLSRMPGFLDFYGIDVGADMWASVSIFATKAAAEEADKLVGEWAKKSFEGITIRPVDVTTGSVLLHKTEATKTKAA